MKGRIINRPGACMNKLIIPRIGSIKVGMKVQGRDGREYPKSVDYFVPFGKYASLFTQAYGEKPQSIQIIFPSDDPEQVCCERYEYRDDDGKLIACGDGESFDVWDGKQYRSMSVKEYPDLMKSIEKRYPNKLFSRTGEGWSITLTLNFLIPCVQGVAGVWQFVTKGTASTIPQIRNVFDAILNEKKYIKGIIFDLNVQFAKSQKPGDRSRYPVVSLVPNESQENIDKIKQAYQATQSIKMIASIAGDSE